jgi:hypothetical protein
LLQAQWSKLQKDLSLQVALKPLINSKRNKRIYQQQAGENPLLAIEVDDYGYHKQQSKQAGRDVMKNGILENYKFPYCGFRKRKVEKEKLIKALRSLQQ